jgi:hypothetical protein
MPVAGPTRMRGRIFRRPHTEHLSPPDRRDVMPWQSLFGVGMSSTNSIVKTTFRITQGVPSFDGLFRSEAQLTPEHCSVLSSGNPATIIAAKTITRGRYFRFGDCNPRAISKLILFLVAMSLVPFVCAELPDEWRISVLTSGIVLEVFAGAILYFAHSRWQARRRDYCLWLKLVHRRVNDL